MFIHLKAKTLNILINRVVLINFLWRNKEHYITQYIQRTGNLRNLYKDSFSAKVLVSVVTTSHSLYCAI